MKTTIDRKDLLAVLAHCAPIAADVFGVCITADEDAVSVRATDLDGVYATAVLAADTAIPGACAVNAAVLTRALRGLKEPRITIERVDDGLRVGTHLLPAYTGNYPVAPSLEPRQPAVAIDSPALLTALTRVIPMVSTDISRPTIGGACLSVEQRAGVTWPMWRLTGTDGHRLASQWMGVADGAFPATIIPRAACLALLGALKHHQCAVDITYDDRNLLFTVGCTEIATRPIDGAFPQWHAMVQWAPICTFTIQRDALLTPLKALKRLAGKPNTKRHDAMRLEFGTDTVGLFFSTDDYDVACNADVPCVSMLEHPGHQRCLNPIYLIEALANAPENITISMTNGPMLLTGNSWFHVIMPMRA